MHPLHTQSVAYIVQRMTSLTTLFYLLALVCYSDARLSTTATRKHILLALCAVSGLLALGTKEIAATLPVFIFLYEWFFFQELKPDWLRRRLPALAGVCVAFGLIVLIFSGFENPVERIFAPYAGGGLTAWQRVMTQFRVVVFYISLLFWPAPSRLNLDHDVAVRGLDLHPRPAVEQFGAEAHIAPDEFPYIISAVLRNELRRQVPGACGLHRIDDLPDAVRAQHQQLGRSARGVGLQAQLGELGRPGTDLTRPATDDTTLR